LARKTRRDRITLAGVKIYPHIGTTLEERKIPQECQADLTLWTDLEGVAAVDSLDHAIDYSKVLSTVQQTAAARQYSLLEALAYRIVRDVLERFPLSRVGIRLRKRPASLRGEIDFVEVEIEES
jgi:dihydroneopterin aldolase